MKQKLQHAIVVLLLLFSLSHTATSCKEDFDPQLTTDVTVLSVASAANSSAIINVTSNADWNVDCSETWLQFSPAEGNGNGSITLTALENADTTIRSATVTVSTEGVSPVDVTVSQNGSQYDLAVSEQTLSFEADEATASFSIISNTSWTVESSVEWLSIEPSEGENNGTISLSAQMNIETKDRSAQITVKGNKTAAIVINVSQKGFVYTIDFSAKTLDVTPSGGEFSFDILTNAEWTLSYAEPWLSVTPSSGSGNTTISVVVDENLKGSERISRLNIESDFFNKKVVRVTQSGIPCGPDDELCCELGVCNVDIPSFASLSENPYLPDPFMFLNGNRMTSLSEWDCRRAEIAVLSQEYQYGYKPCTPYEATTGTMKNDSVITVTVTGNGKTISFDCPITFPTTGSAPYPAVISLGFSMVNVQLQNMGVAVISFPNDAIAVQQNTGSRGQGLFYDYFCKDHSAGALIAWAWGASRLIDAIEKTPQSNINAEKLAVTGCSRNGKGALAVGAFDERIVLTIPFESGSGGAASWRVSDFQGSSVQRLQQIVGENCWFRANFNQFSFAAEKLPYDQHMIMGMCAPRALFVIENPWQTWLGNLSTWTAGNAAFEIFNALGVPENFGFSHIGNSGHCFYEMDETLTMALGNFVQRFLFNNESIDTHIIHLEGSELEYNAQKWVNWTTPELN